jgi:hypothetical protein
MTGVAQSFLPPRGRFTEHVFVRLWLELLKFSIVIQQAQQTHDKNLCLVLYDVYRVLYLYLCMYVVLPKMNFKSSSTGVRLTYRYRYVGWNVIYIPLLSMSQKDRTDIFLRKIIYSLGLF